MLDYNNGLPNYWRDETSGRMEQAVAAYWGGILDGFPEGLSSENITMLKMYLIHWSSAPCYRLNEHATPDLLALLDKAIASAQSINNIDDLSDTINTLMELGIDPF